MQYGVGLGELSQESWGEERLPPFCGPGTQQAKFSDDGTHLTKFTSHEAR